MAIFMQPMLTADHWAPGPGAHAGWPIIGHLKQRRCGRRTPYAMHRTIFTTPGVSGALRALSIAFLHASGWKLDGQLPADSPRCVLIAAPHMHTIARCANSANQIYFGGARGEHYRNFFNGIGRSFACRM